MNKGFNLRPPVTSPVVDESNILTKEWQDFYRQLFLFFQNDFNQNFIKVPSVNNDELSRVPTYNNGTLTYNTDTNELEVLKNGAWKKITTS